LALKRLYRAATLPWPLPTPDPTVPPCPFYSTGTTETASEQKKGYKLPRHIMANGDLARLINSDEIQSVVKPQVRSLISAAVGCWLGGLWVLAPSPPRQLR